MLLLEEPVLSFEEKTTQPWFIYFQIAMCLVRSETIYCARIRSVHDMTISMSRSLTGSVWQLWTRTKTKRSIIALIITILDNVKETMTYVN